MTVWDNAVCQHILHIVDCVSQTQTSLLLLLPLHRKKVCCSLQALVQLECLAFGLTAVSPDYFIVQLGTLFSLILPLLWVRSAFGVTDSGLKLHVKYIVPASMGTYTQATTGQCIVSLNVV